VALPQTPLWRLGAANIPTSLPRAFSISLKRATFWDEVALGPFCDLVLPFPPPRLKRPIPSPDDVSPHLPPLYSQATKLQPASRYLIQLYLPLPAETSPRGLWALPVFSPSDGTDFPYLLPVLHYSGLRNSSPPSQTILYPSPSNCTATTSAIRSHRPVNPHVF